MDLEDARLDCLSPLDGRYQSQTAVLRPIFSERGLILYRIKVEVLYLLKLIDTIYPDLDSKKLEVIKNKLRFLHSDVNFSVTRVKQIESKINHDVKSVEYYIKEKLQEFADSDQSLKKIITKIKPLVHFGLTSQDITTLSLWMQLKDVKSIYQGEIAGIQNKLRLFFKQYKSTPMLAHTHGQIASPTFIGKEFMVFAERIDNQLQQLDNVFSNAKVKFGGAVGNFNAHAYSYGHVNWLKWADEFVESIGFKRAQFTTQIDHYDMMGAYFDCIKRINTILMDLCIDVWEYISRDYLTLAINDNEVGSSAMPHKVNPINFENSEGNLHLANSTFELLTRKLPVSRMQRDLTDSTITRNIGVAFGYTFVALNNIAKGLKKITPNIKVLHKELEENSVVISEGLQSLLKKEGIADGYEMLKEFTRKHSKPSMYDFKQFIKNLDVDDFTERKMLCLSPIIYTGIIPNDYKNKNRYMSSSLDSISSMIGPFV